MISHVVGSVVGHVHHRNTELRRRGEVDAVIADASADDGPAPLQPGEDLPCDGQLVPDHDGVQVTDVVGEIRVAAGAVAVHISELLEDRLLSRHRFGTYEVRAGDLGAVLLQPQLLIGSLTTEPEGECRNLTAA